MKKGNSTLRYARYRAAGWIVNLLHPSNIVYLLLLMGMLVIVLVIQRFEEQGHPVHFFGSGSLPQKRRELIVTTARISSSKVPKAINKCQNQSSMEVKFRFAKDNITFGKITPSPKVIYIPKPRTTQKFISAQIKSNERLGSDQSNSDLIPDIYRLGKTITASRKESSTTKSKQLIIVDRWVRVNNVKPKVMAYSAYWDDRFPVPTVRIIVILATKNPPNVYCRFKDASGKYTSVTGSKKIMNEHWRLKYSSYFLSCEHPKTADPPTQVYLSTDVDHAQEVTLPIHRNKNDSISPRGEIALCVKPLHYKYDRATWLLEFLELHRLLGVDHFYFYNHTVGENVELILQSYIDTGVVTILPWEMGLVSQREIRTEAIFSSLNDCLFRTMFLFKYVIMLDFDEYIIPRDHDTYTDMIHHIEKEHKYLRGKPGSFVFRNTFFYLYWKNDTTVFGFEPEKPPDYLPYLLTQYKTRRLLTSMKPGSRSKYIVVPERAIEVGNHVVWKHTSGSRAINVPDTLALLHHYRICEFGGFSCLKKKSVVDQVATRFGPELLDRVRQQCKIIFRPDGQCPISPPLGSPW